MSFREGAVLDSLSAHDFSDGELAGANAVNPSTFLLHADGRVHSLFGNVEDGGGAPCHRRTFEYKCISGSLGTDFGTDCVLNRNPCRINTCIGSSTNKLMDELGKFHSVKNAAATSEAFAAVAENGQLASWGAFVAETGETRFTHVVATFNAFAGLTASGTVETWGAATAGGAKCRSRRFFSRDKKLEPDHPSNYIQPLAFPADTETWLRSYACFQKDNTNQEATIKSRLKSITSLHSSQAAFVAVNVFGDLIPWGNVEVGGVLPARELAILAEWEVLRKSHPRIVGNITVLGNDLGFFAYVGNNQPRNVWQGMWPNSNVPVSPNWIAWGLHGPDDAYDVNTGERVIDRATLYASKVFSSKDTFVFHANKGQPENKFIAVGPARFSRNKCGFNPANEIPNMELTDVTGNQHILAMQFVNVLCILNGRRHAADEIRRFSNVKHVKSNGGAVAMLTNDRKVLTVGDPEYGGNLTATSVDALYADGNRSFAVVDTTYGAVGLLGKMKTEVPLEHACELAEAVSKVFEGKSRLAFQKTCDTKGLRCTKCALPSFASACAITDIRVNRYSMPALPDGTVQTGGAVGEKLEYSPEFSQRTLRPGRRGYEMVVTTSTEFPTYAITACTRVEAKKPIFAWNSGNTTELSKCTITDIYKKCCTGFVANLKNLVVGTAINAQTGNMLPTGELYTFQFTSIQRAVPTLGSVPCTRTASSTYDCSAGVDIDSGALTLMYGNGASKLVQPMPGKNHIRELNDSYGVFDITFIRPAIRDIIFRDEHGLRLVANTTFHHKRFHYTLTINGAAESVYISGKADSGWMVAEMAGVLPRGIIQHQTSMSSPTAEEAVHWGGEAVNFLAREACQMIPLAGRIPILPNNSVVATAHDSNGRTAFILQGTGTRQTPVDARSPLYKRKNGFGATSFMAKSCEEAATTSDSFTKLDSVIHIGKSDVFVRNDGHIKVLDSSSLSGVTKQPLMRYGAHSITSVGNVTATVHTDGSVYVFNVRTGASLQWPRDFEEEPRAIPSGRCDLRENIISLTTLGGGIVAISKDGAAIIVWIAPQCDCHRTRLKRDCTSTTDQTLKRGNLGSFFVPGMVVGSSIDPIPLANIVRGVGNKGIRGCGSMSFVDSSGFVRIWGEIVDDPTIETSVPLEPVVASSVVATDHAFAAVTTAGIGVAWGATSHGGLIAGETACNLASRVEHIFAINDTFAAIVELSGMKRVVVWPERKNEWYSNPPLAITSSDSSSASVADIYTTDCAFAVRLADGNVHTWGWNSCGGDSSRVQSQLVNVKTITSSAGAFVAQTEVCNDVDCFPGQTVVWGNPEFGGNPSADVLQRLQSGVRAVYADRASFVALVEPKRYRLNSESKISVRHEHDGLFTYSLIRSNLTDIKLIRAGVQNMTYFPRFQPSVFLYEIIIYEPMSIDVNVFGTGSTAIRVAGVLHDFLDGFYRVGGVSSTTVLEIISGGSVYRINVLFAKLSAIGINIAGEQLTRSVSFDAIAAGKQNNGHLLAPSYQATPTYDMHIEVNVSFVSLALSFTEGMVKVRSDQMHTSYMYSTLTMTYIPVPVGVSKLTLTYTPTSAAGAISAPQYTIKLKKQRAFQGVQFLNATVDGVDEMVLIPSTNTYDIVLSWHANVLQYLVYRTSDTIDVTLDGAKIDEILGPALYNGTTRAMSTPICSPNIQADKARYFELRMRASDEVINSVIRRKAPFDDIVLKDNRGNLIRLDRTFDKSTWMKAHYKGVVHPGTTSIRISLIGSIDNTLTVDGAVYVPDTTLTKQWDHSGLSTTFLIQTTTSCNRTMNISVTLQKPGPVACIVASEFLAAGGAAEHSINGDLMVPTRSRALRYYPRFNADMREYSMLVNATVSFVSFSLVYGDGTLVLSSDTHSQLEGYTATTDGSTTNVKRLHLENVTVPAIAAGSPMRVMTFNHSESGELYSVRVARVRYESFQYRWNRTLEGGSVGNESLNRPAYERVNEMSSKYGQDLVRKLSWGNEHTYEGMYAAYFDVSVVDEILDEHAAPVNVEATTNAEGFKRIVDPSIPYATYAVFSSSALTGDIHFAFISPHPRGAITATLSQTAVTPVWVPGAWGQEGTALENSTNPLNNTACDGVKCTFIKGSPYAHRIRIHGMKTEQTKVEFGAVSSIAITNASLPDRLLLNISAGPPSIVVKPNTRIIISGATQTVAIQNSNHSVAMNALSIAAPGLLARIPASANVTISAVPGEACSATGIVTVDNSPAGTGAINVLLESPQTITQAAGDKCQITYAASCEIAPKNLVVDRVAAEVTLITQLTQSMDPAHDKCQFEIIVTFTIDGVEFASTGTNSGVQLAKKFKTQVEANATLSNRVDVVQSGTQLTLTAAHQGVILYPDCNILQFNHATPTTTRSSVVTPSHTLTIAVSDERGEVERVTTEWSGSKSNAEIAALIIARFGSNSTHLAALPVSYEYGAYCDNILRRSGTQPYDVQFEYKNPVGKTSPINLRVLPSSSVYATDHSQFGPLAPTHYTTDSSAKSTALRPGRNVLHVQHSNPMAKEGSLYLYAPLLRMITLFPGTGTNAPGRVAEVPFAFAPSFVGGTTSATLPRTWYLKKSFDIGSVGVQVKLHEDSVSTVGTVIVDARLATAATWTPLRDDDGIRWLPTKMQPSSVHAEVYMVHIRVRCHQSTAIYNVTIVQPPIATLTLNVGGTNRAIQFTGDELSGSGVLNGSSETMIPLACEEPFVDVSYTVRARAGMSSALSIAGTGGAIPPYTTHRPLPSGLKVHPSVVGTRVYFAVGKNYLTISVTVRSSIKPLHSAGHNDDAKMTLKFLIIKDACIHRFEIFPLVREQGSPTASPLSTSETIVLTTTDHHDSNGVYLVHVPMETLALEFKGSVSSGEALILNMSKFNMADSTNQVAGTVTKRKSLNVSRAYLTGDRRHRSDEFSLQSFASNALRYDIQTTADDSIISIWFIRYVLRPYPIVLQDKMICSLSNSMFKRTSVGSIVGNNVGVRFTSTELENHRVSTRGAPINIFTNAKFTLLPSSTSDLAYPSAYFFKADTNAKCYGTGATKECPGRGMLSQVNMHGNSILNASLVYSEVGINRAYLFHMYRARILSLHVFDDAGSTTTAVIPGNVWDGTIGMGIVEVKLSPTATMVKILAHFDENQTMVRVRHVVAGGNSSSGLAVEILSGRPFEAPLKLGRLMTYFVESGSRDSISPVWETYKLEVAMVSCEGGDNAYYMDGECIAKTECSPGTYIEFPGTAVENRRCQPCLDRTYSTLVNAPLCVNHTVCTYPTEYRSVDGTDSSDSACRPTNTCPPGTVLTSPPTLDKIRNEYTSDTVCSACPTGTFSDKNNSLACQPATICQPSFYIASELTSLSDRVCKNCPMGTFTRKLNTKECTPYILVPLYFLFFMVPFSLLMLVSLRQLFLVGLRDK